MKRTLGSAVKHDLVTDKNFKGLQPYFDYKTNTIFYCNKILIIYKNLDFRGKY